MQHQATQSKTFSSGIPEILETLLKATLPSKNILGYS
jgi:hypothetical protein